MSWTQYKQLIDSGNTNPRDWQAAANGNPNDPAFALRLAILKVIENRDAVALDMICHILLNFARRLNEKSNLEDFARELIDKLNDDFGYYYDEYLEEVKRIAERHGIKDLKELA